VLLRATQLGDTYDSIGVAGADLVVSIGGRE
jgi:hypothetical protein